MSSTRSLIRLAHYQWTVIWRGPCTWITLGSLLFITQANFWLGFAWDDAFDPGHLERVFSLVVDALAYLIPILAIVLMGCIQRTGWRHYFVVSMLSVRTLAVVPALCVFAVAAFVALLPGVVIVTSLSPV